MWDPPRPGLEPVSPAPAGRLSTTAPPGKPKAEFNLLFHVYFSNFLLETEENEIRLFVSQDDMHVILTFNIGKEISPLYF